MYRGVVISNLVLISTVHCQNKKLIPACSKTATKAKIWMPFASAGLKDELQRLT